MRYTRAILSSAAFLAGAAAAASAQTASVSEASARSVPAPDPTARAVPFGPGETLRYKLKLGIFNVGEGHLSVEAIDTVRGFPTYRLGLGIKGSAMFGAAKVDDHYQSWLDTRMLVSRRFVRDVHQLDYKSRREFEIYPEEQRWERVDAEKDGRTGGMLPLDEVAFIYYIRTLPLEVGETYTLNRYFKEEGNPVVVKVLRREEKEVPAGTFNTIVVQPIIQTSGLFSEGGNAEIYFSDDEKRRIVYLRSEVPVVGSMTLHLEEAVDGVPLNPAARRSAGR